MDGAGEVLLRRRMRRDSVLKLAADTRYDKTAASFLGVLCLAADLDWLKR